MSDLPPLSKYIQVIKEKKDLPLPIYSVTLSNGMQPRDTLGRSVLSELESKDNLFAAKGDICYNMMRMWQGASGLVPEDCHVSPAYVVCRPKENLDPIYASYMLKSQEAIKAFIDRSQGVTSDRWRLYPDEFLKVSLFIPPLPEQKKIAEILSGIDRSIYALSQKISKERLLANAVTSELLAKIVSKSEMGTIGNVATFITKGTTPTSVGLTFSQKGVAFVKAQSIGGSGETIRSTFSFIDENAHKQLSRSSLKANDVLVTIAGTIGRSAVVPEDILPANTNQAVAIVRLDPSRMLSSFLSAWIRSKQCQAHFTGLQTIGAQPNVSLQQISETLVPLISIADQSHFISAYESFYSSLNSLIIEKERYSFMKKSLASDLLSGRRRVSV